MTAKISFIFIGGGLGAVSRYLLQGVVQTRAGSSFPAGTMAVNIIGCFVIGVLWALFEEVPVQIETRLFLITGFLGGFTTFSSFGVETLNLIRDGEYGYAAIYVGLSNLAGFACVFIGMIVSRALLSAAK